MQNKSAIWTFTILLTLACLFQISYSWVTNSVENEAEAAAQMQLDSILGTKQESITYGSTTYDLKKPVDQENLRNVLVEEQLRKVAHEPAYPILGETYQDCKKRELSLGLDLKGGMAVTVEVSIPDLVYNLAGKSNNPSFKNAYSKALEKSKLNPGQDFIEVFYQEFTLNNPNARLASVFSAANKDKFPSKSTNEEILDILRREKESALSNIEQIMNNRINKFGVSNATIQRQAGSGRIQIELPGVKDKIRVRQLIQATANLEFWLTYHNYELQQKIDEANTVLSRVLYPDLEGNQSVNDTSALASDSTVSGKDTSLVVADSSKTTDTSAALAKADTSKTNPTDSLNREEAFKKFPLFRYLSLNVNPETNQWNEGSVLGSVAISDTAKLSALLNHPELENVWPSDLKFLYDAKPLRFDGVEQNRISLYLVKGVKGQAILNGDVITEARQDYNELSGGVEVIMQMNAKGSEQWATITDNNKGRAIAIVMDEVVYSAPMVNEKITGGRSQISGNFTVDEGSDLANVLKSGTLPARAIIVDEQIIGPSLGAANVTSGVNSFILAMVVVLLYMYVYYKKAGLIANIALIANVFFLIGSLASIQASLTLPGIAGIVLTIGMAVDANVLIYERIREELRGGKSLKTAVNDGFKFALSSIIDGNLTTLLTAIVLATFGSGPVLGFAVTLIIGIMTSLFSAIFISRLIIHELLDRKQDISFSTKFSENLMVGTKINFMGRRKLWYVVSSLFIIAGIASLFTRSLDYGVEFTGGRTFEITFQDEANYDKIRENLGAVFVENGQKLTPEVKMIENKYKAKITTKYLVTEQDSTADRKVEDALKTGLKEWEGKYTVDAQRKIGGVISSEMISSSIWSVVFSLIVIFAYIYIRFRKWQFGFAAVLALFHDAMIVLSVFSLCYGILPFSMEIDQAFIAAILTVIGYSINDTVVVFDRIREYMTEHKRMETSNMINSALNSTLTRTINTSLTTLIVLVVIFIFGGDSIKGFTFALLVGIGVGTYSSLFIASPIVYDFAGNTLTEATEKKD